jgi:uncharacterized phage protein gp47/JayE
MGINTREELEAKLVAEMVAEQEEITAFEPKTAIRGFITAVAGTVRELWNDLYRMQRKIFLNTSSGKDLDELGAERGITRQGAASAGVILTFTGDKDTLIPEGTEVENPSTKLVYETTTDLKLGEKNPDLVVDDESKATSATIADTVWAICKTSGSIGNSQVNTINKLSNGSIVGVKSVTNYSPAQGGADAESDGLFREKIRNYISILNQGTQSFYEALCKSINSRVLRVKAKKDSTRLDSIKLIIITADGALLSDKDLAYLGYQVMSRHRAFTNVICENIKFVLVTVSERVKLLPGYRIEDVFIKTADACANFFDYKSWEFGKSISVDNVFNVCYNVEGVDDIELTSFKVKSGSINDATVSQVLHTKTASSSGDSTISFTISELQPAFVENSLVGKFVRISSGGDSGDTAQIKSNTEDTVTIFSKWKVNPEGGSEFKVVELYRYSTSTTLLINEDAVPYFDGLDITDIDAPLSSTKAAGIINKNIVNKN